MLITPLYNGQGLGNQLACYITTRCLALDKGYEFGVMFPERCKWFNDLHLPSVPPVEHEEGKPFEMEGMTYYRETSSDYDPFVLDIPDNYILHGNLQGEKYFEKHKEEIRDWLTVEPLDMPDDLCVINFRGGEYVGVPAFFLPQSYWQNGIEKMLEINPNMKFEVHTDDPNTAKLFFPDYPIIQNMELNWRSIRYAKYLLLSNSTFALFPSWLNEDVKLAIAPKYFGRFNEEYWFLEQNKMNHLTYMDKHGNLDNK